MDYSCHCEVMHDLNPKIKTFRFKNENLRKMKETQLTNLKVFSVELRKREKFREKMVKKN